MRRLNSTPPFIKGVRLSELFYEEAVKPVLDFAFPELPYSAALIGPGSEVMGYDTPQSTDHHWGPRLLLFLDEKDFPGHSTAISETLSRQLPYTFYGYPTNFGSPDEIGVRLLQPITSGPVNHRVEIYTVRAFFEAYLGLYPRSPLPVESWLTLPEQRLLGCTSGKVFHDGLGTLQAVRETLAYYPEDIWLYLLASQWKKVAEEEAFVGRAGDVGDELGSRLIAARLAHFLMRLCFLMERRYAPYPKWFGMAFGELACAPLLAPVLDQVLSASSWREREKHLSHAYEMVAGLHNALAITAPVDATVPPYYDRPYLVIHADRFVTALHSAITSDAVRGLPLVGSVNQFMVSTTDLEDVALSSRLRLLYQS